MKVSDPLLRAVVLGSVPAIIVSAGAAAAFASRPDGLTVAFAAIGIAGALFLVALLADAARRSRTVLRQTASIRARLDQIVRRQDSLENQLASGERAVPAPAPQAPPPEPANWQIAIDLDDIRDTIRAVHADTAGERRIAAWAEIAKRSELDYSWLSHNVDPLAVLQVVSLAQVAREVNRRVLVIGDEHTARCVSAVLTDAIEVVAVIERGNGDDSAVPIATRPAGLTLVPARVEFGVTSGVSGYAFDATDIPHSPGFGVVLVANLSWDANPGARDRLLASTLGALAPETAIVSSHVGRRDNRAAIRHWTHLMPNGWSVEKRADQTLFVQIPEGTHD